MKTLPPMLSTTSGMLGTLSQSTTAGHSAGQQACQAQRGTARNNASHSTGLFNVKLATGCSLYACCKVPGVRLLG